MLLSSFEESFPATILDKGKKYFKSGAVFELDETANGKWLARVAGTDEYEVNIRLKGDEVDNTICTCPYYDQGDCKHIVATLFAIRKEISSSTENSSDPKKIKKKETNKKAKSGSKKLSVKDKLQLIRKETDVNLLADLLIEIAADNRKITDLLFIQFTHLWNNDTKEQYEEMIKTGIKRATERSGFIEYGNNRIATEIPYQLLEKCERLFEKKQFEEIIHICFPIIKHIDNALMFADDSNGEMGSCIESALEFIYKLANEAKENTLLRNVLWEKLLEAIVKKWGSHFDAHDNLINLVIIISKDSNERKIIEDWLDSNYDYKEMPHYWNKTGINEYAYQKLIEYKIIIATLNNDNETKRKLLNNNIHLDHIRQLLIHEAIQTKNLIDAERMCIEGIAQDVKRQLYGLVDKWKRLLTSIYKLSGEKEKNRALLFDITVESQQMADYRELKKLYSEAEIPTMIEKLLKRAGTKNNWKTEQFICSVYSLENMTDELIKTIKQSKDFGLIEAYHTLLLAKEVDFLKKRYILKIENTLQNTGRNFYNEAVGLMRRLKKYGFEKDVLVLKAKYLEIYKKRPALIDELKKV